MLIDALRDIGAFVRHMLVGEQSGCVRQALPRLKPLKPLKHWSRSVGRSIAVPLRQMELNIGVPSLMAETVATAAALQCGC